MRRIGQGEDVALWFNGNARRVTPKVIAAFRDKLPRARTYICSDFDSARAMAKELAAAPPLLLFCGGGDGTAVTLLNYLREAGSSIFPRMALLRLGTGNGWPRATNAPSWESSLKKLSQLSIEPRTTRFQLVEVEGQLCQFAGVGWDATVLHDYRRNLEKRAQQLVASELVTKLHKGMLGYLYSTYRITVPEELGRLVRKERTRVVVENQGEPAIALDPQGDPLALPKTSSRLYDGYVSVGAAACEPYWGLGFKAFPHAQRFPGRINVRVYDRPIHEAVARSISLWRGGLRDAGMHDYFVTKAKMTFSRPVPFQIGGDVQGLRETVEYQVAKETLELLDWSAAH